MASKLDKSAVLNLLIPTVLVDLADGPDEVHKNALARAELAKHVGP